MTTNKFVTIRKKRLLNSDDIFCSILSIFVIAIICIILSDPKKYNLSVLQGLNLFITCVLPGLFPFMFLTKLLTNLGMVQKISTKFSKFSHFMFGTSGISFYVFLMSILSGYPIGAKLIYDLYSSNAISHDDAKKMVTFCTTSGPIFIIGTVGAVMFGSAKVGIIIYACHILSSIICGIIFAGKRKKQIAEEQNNQSTSSCDNLFASTMKDTVSNIFLVGAYITIFFLFADILANTGILNILIFPIKKLFSLLKIQTLSSGFVGGIIEVTRGVKMLSCNLTPISVCMASAIISFSGISIILQSMAYLKKCKIKARYFIFVKLVHSVLCFVLCYLVCNLINPF